MLSSVSIGIIPIAKKPARTNAACILSVVEATDDNVRVEIWIAVSNPRPNTIPVIKDEPNGPSNQSL